MSSSFITLSMQGLMAFKKYLFDASFRGIFVLTTLANFAFTVFQVPVLFTP